MLSVTPTKLGDYLICPHKFNLKHIKKSGAFASSPAFSFGTSMHRALEELHSGEYFPVSLPEAEKMLRQFWEKAAYANAEEEGNYFDKGCQALLNYCKLAGQEANETLGTEVYMSFVIDLKGLKIRLGCKADRIALHPNQNLEVVDYKTNASGKVPTLEFLQADLATFLYYVLTKLTYPQYPQITITFLNVMTMRKVSVHYGADQIEANKQSLWQCLKTLAGEKFLPRSSEACAWCDFQDACPAANQIIDFSVI